MSPPAQAAERRATVVSAIAGISQHGLKVAAGRIGVTTERFLERYASGMAWCSDHCAWHPASDFQRNKNRWTGLKNICRSASAERDRAGVTTIYGARS